MVLVHVLDQAVHILVVLESVHVPEVITKEHENIVAGIVVSPLFHLVNHGLSPVLRVEGVRFGITDEWLV